MVKHQHLQRNLLKRTLLLLILLAATHCGNTGVYDEALTRYYRVIRPGLTEWYPLNGNLSPRVGTVSGVPTTTYTAGTSRDGTTGKAVCTTTSRFDFASAPMGANPFTVSAWVKVNTITAGPNSLLQRGVQQTGYRGFIISQFGTTSIPSSLGDGSLSTNFTGIPAAAGVWYYLALSYGSGAGTFYVGRYGSTLNKYGPTTGNYAHYTVTDFQVFVNTIDACVDDLLHYNRVLSADEVNENFLTLE